jgi:hypothetical protein
MPFFNNRSKKYGGNGRQEAKIPLILAHKSTTNKMELII